MAQSHNILAVDDEREICVIIDKFLTAEGYEVKTAMTGKKAISLVGMKHYDVVFLDIVMPGISGIEVLEKVKEISPKTKVIIITGSLLDKSRIRKLQQKGASGFLAKPFMLEDILRIIREIDSPITPWEKETK